MNRRPKHKLKHPWRRIKHPIAFRRWRDNNRREYRIARMRFLVENGIPSAK